MAKKKSNVDESQCIGNCFDCENSTYIGEGDYMCDECGEPVIVITEFIEPTEHFNRCNGKKW